MRRESGTPLYICSLNESKERTEEVFSLLLGRPVTACEGAYEGEEEWSVLIPSEDMNDAVRAALAASRQRCVLYLDGQRNAFLCPAPLYNVTVEAQYLGELVSKETVGSTKSYTKVNGLVYYVR